MKKVVLVFFLLSFTYANEYAVIANKKLPPLNPLQIKAIFLKKLTIVHDISILPLNLNARHQTRLAFEKEILHMSFTRLKNYWSKQHYLGHRPPLSIQSQQSVKKFVKKVDGAIGYVDIKFVDKDVNVLYRWSE